MIVETRKTHINGREVDLVIRRHDRAKNYKIRYDASGLQVLLTLPKRGSLRQALAFYEKSIDWLRRHLPPLRSAIDFTDTVLYLGKVYQVRQSQTALKKFNLLGDTLYVKGDINSTVIAWLKIQASQHLSEISERMATQLGVAVNSVKIKDLKSRWGSCSAKGNLNYSWRIIMAPPRVIEYLCAHEVSHLVEMNHSPAFWKLVNALCQDYKTSRKWLRTEGKGLLRYG